jgi:uncharacterized protein (TIGR00255 family)
MTGYGLAGFEDDNYVVSVEVKTLNSKFLDLSIRSPKQFSDKELEIRNLVSGILERGKVNLNLDFSYKSSDDIPLLINEELFLSYFKTYQNLSQKVKSDTQDLFKLALQSPLVLSSNGEKKSDPEEWETVKKVIESALKSCDVFRQDEGNTLEVKFFESVSIIRQGLDTIRMQDPERKTRIRERIKGNFKDWMEENNFDQNRLEQELIYYFEKIDITEEIVRLESHLDYFEKNLKAGDSQGKKLGFISQEIGREINTIGSKANDAMIQRSVVVMKDELEKIKEQSLNIL